MTLDRRSNVLLACCVIAVVGAIFWAWAEFAPRVRPILDLRRQAKLFGQPFEPYVQRLRDAGEPVTFEALEGEMPADADNAAGEIEAAWKWVVDTAGPEKSWTAPGPWRADWSETWDETATPDEIEALRRFLDGLRPFVERTSAALHRPALRYPLTLDETGAPESKWTPRIQAVSRLLEAHARFARRPEERLAAIACCALLGRQIADGDGTMNLMIGAVDTGIAVRALRRSLEAGELVPSSARAELDGLLAEQWLPRIRGLIRHERAAVISAYRAAANGKAAPGAVVQKPEFAAMYVAACEAFNRALQWGPLPYGEWRRRYEEVTDETATRQSLFVRLVPPKAAEQFCRTDAATRLARIALALAEHRAKHGEFPSSLADLASAFKDGVPLDPYADAPFVYERTATGARIASVRRLPEESPLDAATLRERCLVWELKR